MGAAYVCGRQVAAFCATFSLDRSERCEKLSHPWSIFPVKWQPLSLRPPVACYAKIAQKLIRNPINKSFVLQPTKWEIQWDLDSNFSTAKMQANAPSDLNARPRPNEEKKWIWQKSKVYCDCRRNSAAAEGEPSHRAEWKRNFDCLSSLACISIRGFVASISHTKSYCCCKHERAHAQKR